MAAAGAASPVPLGADAGSPVAVRWALGALLALSLALRVWYLAAGLDGQRFFDERFSLRNVSVLIAPERGERLHFFYPTLSFLPQAAVLAASDGLHRLTGAPALRVLAAEGYTPLAYFLVRAVSALFGLGSLLMLFLIGRRLFSPAVGLLAATLFAVLPRHVHTSAIFKPDILVALLVLVAFWWSLDAGERGSRRDFWLAGCGLGLAMAAKYTGIAALGPLVIAALAGHWREPRRWRLLIEAGLASLVTFAALNPQFAAVLRFLPKLWRIGQDKGVESGVTFASVARSELDFLLYHHTPAIFACAVIGAAGLTWGALRRPGDRATVPTIMSLTLVAGYSLLWIGLRFFRGHYYLPVAAFTSLYAAWLLCEVGRRLLVRLPAGARAPAAWGAALALAAALAIHPLAWTYRQVVPTTWSVAGAELRRVVAPPRELRSVLLETDADEAHVRLMARGLHPRRVTNLLAEPPTADVEIFPAARLVGSDAASYRSRLAAAGVGSLRIDPVAFRTHGTAVVLLLRRWEIAAHLEAPAPAAGRPQRQRRFTLPEPLRAGDHVSLQLRIPNRRGVPAPAFVVVSGQRVPVNVVVARPRRLVLSTPRFALPAGMPGVPLALPAQLGWPAGDVEAQLWLWRPSEPRLRAATP